MNTLQTIWSALTVPNPMLTNILGIPLTYLDAYIGMLFFSTLLNIDTPRKKKLIYVLIYGTLGIILNFIIPSTYKIFINLIVWPIIIYFILLSDAGGIYKNNGAKRQKFHCFFYRVCGCTCNIRNYRDILVDKCIQQ